MSEALNSRRDFLKTGAIATIGSFLYGISARANLKRLPNAVLIFCDDLGYGDLGCYGSTVHRTPSLDRMANEGIRFTDFYVTSGVCTPSRSSLMTGCYPRTVNMHMNYSGDRANGMRQVLFPIANNGLNPRETTIAEVLKSRGYATACIGKWHLGDQPEFLPTRQGFDTYFGIPYSNDMGIHKNYPDRPALPLMRDEQVIEAPVDQDTITRRYTEEAIGFIKTNRDKPFFVYLPHAMPHNPVHASERFRDTSNDRYGDSVQEIDWSTGEIMRTLEYLGIAESTLVIFTSDNGAASAWGGSNLPLRGWKASSWEGGQRVPCIMWWPTQITSPSREWHGIASTLDIMPTLADLAGANISGLTIDNGISLRPVLDGRTKAMPGERVMYYYVMNQLQAVRRGKWKLHLPLDDKYVAIHKNDRKPSPLALYDLSRDIGETTDLSAKNPDVTAELMKLTEYARTEFGDGNATGRRQRDAGFVADPKPIRGKSPLNLKRQKQ